MVASELLVGVKADIIAHAREEAPRECCGLIVKQGNKAIAVRCANESSEPEITFRMNPDDFAAAEEIGEVLAVYHSHPNAKAAPSDPDKASAEATELPFLICGWPADEERVAGVTFDDRVDWAICLPTGNPLPYEGRPFVHGILDCYTLFRDWWTRERGITFPDFHRPDDWWHKGQNLYLDHMEETGWIRLKSPREAKVGDVFLIQVMSPVPNHAAIYLGDGLMLHHPPGRLSGTHPYVCDQGYYATHTFCAIRHKSAFDTPTGV
jgi:cell wall-associated NlpC family hydrolase